MQVLRRLIRERRENKDLRERMRKADKNFRRLGAVYRGLAIKYQDLLSRKETAPPRSSVALGSGFVANLLTTICEMDPEEPDDPDTVCVNVHKLLEVLRAACEQVKAPSPSCEECEERPAAVCLPCVHDMILIDRAAYAPSPSPSERERPTPAALTAMAEWFDNPNLSPGFAIKCSARMTPGMMLRMVASGLERALTRKDGEEVDNDRIN